MAIQQNIKLTVDALVFGVSDKELSVLLIQRKDKSWAIPGGFVDDNEALKTAAQRELEEETGIKAMHLFQFYTFGDDVNRDPRGHTVAVAHMTVMRKSLLEAKAGSDARNLKWVNWKEVPPLSFDHNLIIKKAIQKLQQILQHQLPEINWLKKELSEQEIQQIRKEINQTKA
ncbi:MAG: NUDIX hydrolase [Crocinitomicaceae bacterium]